MAVDTENKRRSVIAVLPEPDGTIAQADRQQVSWIYSGILAETPPVAVTPTLKLFGRYRRLQIGLIN